MKIHLTGGFLGSGKTTAIRHACSVLIKQGTRVGVITNDQGIKLVDGFFFDSLKIPARQVINGCFCCNYNDLDSHIQSLIAMDESAVIFAESVGSCTDMVATVMRPLLQFRPAYGITVSIFADACLLYRFLADKSSVFSEDVSYIYFKQLEEAGIIVVNKIDLLGKEHLEKLKQILDEKYAGKMLLYQNSLDEDDIMQWMDALDNHPPLTELRSLQIDYDIYGAGEARLAWLDQEMEIYSHINNAVAEAMAVVQNIHRAIRQRNYPIGHLKFLLNGEAKISFTSTTQEETGFDVKKEKAFSARLLVNARVETSPENLSELVSGVCRKMQAETGCSIIVKSESAFQPGYPKPTYRILNEWNVPET